MTEESQEISIECQEEPQEEPLPTPTKKPKRIMSEAQKQNLIKARQKAAELRNQLKQKKPVVKKLSKLEKELETLKEEEEPKTNREKETTPPPPSPKPVEKPEPKQEQEPYRPRLVKSDDGFFYIV